MFLVATVMFVTSIALLQMVLTESGGLEISNVKGCLVKICQYLSNTEFRCRKCVQLNIYWFKYNLLQTEREGGMHQTSTSLVINFICWLSTYMKNPKAYNYSTCI